MKDYFKAEIEQLKRQGLFRSFRCVESAQGPEVMIEGKSYLCFCSNNYLGLADHPSVKKAALEAIRQYGVGAGASRLISGDMNLHEELESKIALFKGKESGIVFSTGYMANTGTISALVGKGDLIIIDKLNHASIIDGWRLSGADIRVYPHKNMRKLEKILRMTDDSARKLIVTDSLFSMDGDIAPLEEIVFIAKKYGAITMIDEAHATGVFGKRGSGVAEYLGVEKDIDIIMGTFTKALGSMGGYIVGSQSLIDYIRNKARSFIYTTGLPPCVCGASIAALDIVISYPELREKLWKNVQFLQKGLTSLGYKLLTNESQIIPVVIGQVEQTMNLSKFLFKKGILIPGIRPPTVSRGTSRLRISVMANHKKEHMNRCLEALEKAKKECQ